MVRRVALLLAAAGHAALAAPIDFTPAPIFVEFEGRRVEQPGFRHGDGLVTFEPPSGWTLNGGGPVLELTPKESSFATARVESRPLPVASVASEDGLKLARSYVAAFLPKESEGLKWDVEPKINPVLLNKHETVRLEGGYSRYNQPFRVSVTVCNLADQQLIFVVTARERDFRRLDDLWKRTFFTWQGLK